MHVGVGGQHQLPLGRAKQLPLGGADMCRGPRAPLLWLHSYSDSIWRIAPTSESLIKFSSFFFFFFYAWNTLLSFLNWTLLGSAATIFYLLLVMLSFFSPNRHIIGCVMPMNGMQNQIILGRLQTKTCALRIFFFLKHCCTNIFFSSFGRGTYFVTFSFFLVFPSSPQSRRLLQWWTYTSSLVPSRFVGFKALDISCRCHVDSTFQLAEVSSEKYFCTILLKDINMTLVWWHQCCFQKKVNVDKRL